MKWFVFCFLVLAVTGSAAGDDAQREAILRSRLYLIEEAKAEAETTIEAMKKGAIRRNQRNAAAKGTSGRYYNKYSFRTKEDRERAIEDFKREVSDEWKVVPPLLIRNAMNLGEFGYLPVKAVLFDDAPHTWHFEVQQVIDDSNMLVRVTCRNHATSRPTEAGDYLVWVVGNFGAVTDGMAVKFNDVFLVTGTRQYATTFGTRTVFVLEIFDIAPIIERLQAEAAKKKPAKEDE